MENIIQQYLKHPFHKDLNINITAEDGTASIKVKIEKPMLNLAGILHGAYYFKFMDDACFFAGLSLGKDSFIATANFTIQYINPVANGNVIANASIVNKKDNKYIIKATIIDDNNVVCTYGSGLFVKPRHIKV